MKGALVAGCMALVFAATAARADEIVVLSTTGLQAVIKTVGPKFEQATGNKLAVSIDTANNLRRKIDDGAAFDVAVLTPALIDALIQNGKIVRGSAANIARAGVGIAYRAGGARPDVSSLAALKQTLLAAKSITYATTGQSGAYFTKLIERIGIVDQVAAKSKALPGGLGVGELVAHGEAELAIQSVPDLKAIPGLEVIPFPAELQSYIVLTGGLATDAKSPAAAAAFIKYLTDPAAVPVLKAKGLEPG
jgi:molybdate transport system substrate-binding protein